MREKPPIAFYNFLPLVSRGIEDTGRAPEEEGGGGGEGKSCQDRLFTQGLIENAVSHRAIRLGNLRGSFEPEIEPEEFLCYAPRCLRNFCSRRERFFYQTARESNDLLFTRNFVPDF